MFHNHFLSVCRPRIAAASLTRIVGLLGAFALLANPLLAAVPASGTINPGGPSVMWAGSASGGASADESTCVQGVNCDSFAITLSGTPADWIGKQATVDIKWTSSVNDYDLFIHKGDLDGPVIASSAQGSTITEQANIDPNSPAGADGVLGTGLYTVNVVYFAATAADQYSGAVNVTAAPLPPAPGASPTPPANPAGAPGFFNYTPPGGLGRDAGEPTLGANWKSGNVMFQAGLETLRVTFDDCTSPAKATWVNRPGPNTDITSLDPILFTDNETGRTFVSQLTGENSLSSFTDDDGETYTPSTGGPINSGVDHQSIGGGPFRRVTGDPGPVTGYPHAVYYSSQSIASAFTGLSRDGGLTYNGNGGGVPMYTLADCGGLHGHPKVAPDGTVYVPNKGCGGEQAVAVSEDNGKTWMVRRVPGSKPGESDPSLGIGRNDVGKPGTNLDGTNTIYFGYTNVDGHARIAVSRDRGRTWTDDQDVGAFFGVQNSVFPVVIAGDDDRAAFAFLGSTTAGAAATGEDPTLFGGEWHIYVATTYDGGKTWLTTDVTPNDPVQRGIVCTQGTLCETGRNLLDFNDIDVDKFGRILVGYADGCIDDCVQGGDNSGTALGTIARQSSGRRLFAQHDPSGVQAPATPQTNATLTSGNVVRVTWNEPDNGGSPITGYNIYRGPQSGAEAVLATVGPDVRSFEDNAGSAVFSYQVTALNAVGESAKCGSIFPEAVVVQSPCALPGRTVAQDPTGDQTGVPINADLDIESVSIAEPFFPDGSNNLVFTMKVATLAGFPPNRQYRVIWTPKNPPSGTENRYYVGMNTNAGGSAASATYEFGTVSATGNVPTRRGAADAGSANADGTITITIANSKVGSPVAGDTLSTVSGRTFAGTGNANVSLATSADSSGDAAYNLVGNAFCANGGPVDTVPTLSRLLNISTRLRVEGGENVLIGGFIVDGTTPKQVVLRAIGPSLSINGQPVEGRLEDPVLELRDGNGALITENDNWRDSQQPEIEASGLRPNDDRESTIVRSLIPGPYTAIMRGKDNGTGIGLVEAYDRGDSGISKLANLSSRGFVERGDNVMIGGFIVGGGTTGPVRVVVRAIGPTLSKAGLANPLQDPVLELVDSNGNVIRGNDNWRTDQQAEIQSTGLAPMDDRESALLEALPLGNFTAVVRGKSETSGVGLVEVYNIP